MLNSFFSFFTYADSPTPWQWGFQDPASPIMEGIIHLHNAIFWLLIVILTFVLWLLFRVVILFSAKSHNSVEDISHVSQVTHASVLEIVWTIIPAFILGLIAIPSFVLLYSTDEVINPAITVKAIGHQWYWSYEIQDGDSSINFDSYMVPDSDLKLGQIRLLEVDHSLVLPVLTHVRVLVTATDVLHAWAVPSLGVKVDAVPGRLNQTSIFIKRQGIFRGQCSELCGVNHGFMPIVVEGVDLNSYLAWITSNSQ